MRDANIKRVLEIIRLHGETTKKEVARETRLSLTLINNIVNDLIKRKLVVQERLGISSGGRRPMVLRFAEDSYYAVGLVITSGRVHFALSDLNLSILHQKEFALPLSIGLHEGSRLVEKGVNAILGKLKLDPHKICGIGVVSPWLDDYAQQQLVTQERFAGQTYKYKKRRIPLHFEDVATSIALAAKKELEPGTGNVVFVSIGNSVDAQIFLSGAHYMGEHGLAGNVAHMAVVNEGRKCVCGRSGCWEAYVSVTNMARDYNGIATKKVASYLEIAQKIAERDEAALRIIENYTEHVWWGLRNIINLYDPAVIIFGGPISDFRDALQPVINKRLRALNVLNRVLFSAVTEGAELKGALTLPVLKLFSVGNTI